MKKTKNNSVTAVKIGGGLLAAVLAPGVAHACACGCGVFDVGTSSMFPDETGGMAYFSSAYQDQSENQAGTSRSNADNNADKQIRTAFFNIGAQYLFNNNWGLQFEMPWDYRFFKTVDDNTGKAVSTTWGSLGDLRLQAVYTGFKADLSAGITFGLKLPTGNYNYNPAIVDRDTQIGTGSMDLLLGGYYRGNLTQDEKWDWFAQANLDVPTLIQAQYRPGVELDSAAGIDYKGFAIGRMRIAPLAQVIVSYRSPDSGAASASADSGYERVLLSPGVEFHLHPVKLYADVEIPVYDHVNGNQLVAPVLFKMNLSYMF